MMFDPGSIPWDHPVEIFEVMSNLRVKSIGMTLRQAVEIFRDTPEDARWSLGVGLQRCPAFCMIGGSPVAVGFLNASALKEMIELLPAAETR
jgi:hypothetical protein